MGGPLKCAAAFAAVLACAACLSACGGGGGDSTQTAAAGSESTSPAAGAAGGGDNGGKQGSNDSESEDPVIKPPDRGTVSKESAEFEQYSRKGKLHLAEFGDEASGGDRGEVEDIVVAYLQASGQEEWDKACSYLSPTVVHQLHQLSASQGASGESCGETLAKFAESPLAKEVSGSSPIYAPEGISSLRIQQGGRAGDGAGFALFHGSDGEDHWMAVKVEGGRWRILSSFPQPFL